MLLKDAIEQNDILVKLADARDFFEGCIPGWQQFAEANGFKWQDIVRHGLTASTLYATNDAMAIQLLTHLYRDKL